MKNKNGVLRLIFTAGLLSLLCLAIGVYANERSAGEAMPVGEDYASLLERREEIEQTSDEGVEGKTLAARIQRQTALMEDFAAYYETHGWEKYDGIVYDGIDILKEQANENIMIINDYINMIEADILPPSDGYTKEELIGLYRERIKINQAYIDKISSAPYREATNEEIKALSGEFELMYFLPSTIERMKQVTNKYPSKS